MIPKIIHYCWISDEPYPEKIQKCMDSWKKYLPDYEFKKWDSKTFDLQSVPYVAQALKWKKYAFIADYVRIWALKNFGGIYLDSDVEVLKSFDDLLNQKAFCCFENPASEKWPTIEAAVMGSEKNGKWINEMFKYFDGKNFEEKGVCDITPVPFPMGIKTKELYGLKFNNQTQIFDDLTIYSRDYFSPKSLRTREISVTEKTYAIHHFAGSWGNKFAAKITPYIEKWGFWGKVLCTFRHPVTVAKYLSTKNHYMSTFLPEDGALLVSETL